MGNPIWDYTHQCDHTELRDILHTSRPAATEKVDKDANQVNCNAMIRIKCTLTSRGRNVNIKSASYKVRRNESYTQKKIAIFFKRKQKFTRFHLISFSCLYLIAIQIVGYQHDRPHDV